MGIFHQWWLNPMGNARGPLKGDAPALLFSFLIHLCAIIGLGLVPIAVDTAEVTLVVQSLPPDQRELDVPDEFTFSDQPSDEIGANSVMGEAMALSMAPIITDFSSIPSQVTALPIENARIEINDILETATGLHYAENLAVKGAAGEGTTGAVGAIDRITHEILLSLEERKTIVVWLFDETASLIPQRQAIRDRFEKIYRELGVVESSGNEAFAKHNSKPLLSSIIGFGNAVKFLTPRPTDHLADLKKAVMEVPDDSSGTENVFSAIIEAASRHSHYRSSSGSGSEDERNVIIVVFTDEAGTDTNRAEDAIRLCRRLAMPVYVIGVPAPFGRKETEMKWVDPDPKFDQSPQWGIVEQGPESLWPERIKLSFPPARDEDDIDSGFGPYALTRLCFETGGIYFAVHPNRSVGSRINRRETAAYSSHLTNFFDSDVMRRYRPDYVSINEYQKRVKQNKARAALVEAAAASLQLPPVQRPTQYFVKRDEAEFNRALSAAQQTAAALEPRINAICQLLQQAEDDREKETELRWQAGYDLAMGTALAVKVRTESYNAMLAAAKRGLKPEQPRNNTWELLSSDEVVVGSQYAKLADKARTYFRRVVNDHPGTPWALLAQQELNSPLSWKWKDSYTDLGAEAKAKAKMGNNNNAMPRNDQKTMLSKPAPKRPLPKL